MNVFEKCWLAVSGRLPADMVLKPLLLGIPLVASVSAPTSDGIEEDALDLIDRALQGDVGLRPEWMRAL